MDVKLFCYTDFDVGVTECDPLNGQWENSTRMKLLSRKKKSRLMSLHQ